MAEMCKCSRFTYDRMLSLHWETHFPALYRVKKSKNVLSALTMAGSVVDFILSSVFLSVTCLINHLQIIILLLI